MELSKTFDPAGLDDRWYKLWMDHHLFESKPDVREPYTIVIPPPNVTGVLHMGHSLNNTIQDVLIRRARMQGKNACWVPGTDHASIATEAKVVGMLRERKINKSTITRDEFLKYAWEWTEKYGGIILQQLRKLGCSCDWTRTVFTMDEDYYRSVIRVFIDLYNKGYIYRGLRMIHWDPKAKTALSDEEVMYREVKSKLYYIRYRLDRTSYTNHDSRNTTNEGDSQVGTGETDFITIATVRPETILGDTAIAVNPGDLRYQHLKGAYAFVPLINRRIPIIFDDYVQVEFGTGALKVTPAHDMNDYQLGLRHKLEVVDVLNEDGTMSKAAHLHIGEDRFEARKKIVMELEEKDHLDKTEDYTHQVGFSERTEVVIEPRLSMQWWCRMKEIAEPALEAVIRDDITFYPSKFKNTYRYWMENIRDWCISRQLWWGHRIPAFYLPDGKFVVAKNIDEAYEKAIADFGLSISDLKKEELKQDDDVLDTWFSSWLWPFEVFRGLSDPGNKDFKYYYPTNTLVTAPEIIFFWVARMIMSGFEFMHEKPFNEVYFTGIVRDKIGRKMSKQFGNSPDLLELIDKYGADAVRFGILISSPAGNDLLFDEKLIEQGRNFNNKIWNALRLIKGWEVKEETRNEHAAAWFESKFNKTVEEIERLFADFQISAVLKVLYSLIWDDFCSWYLEMIKPEFGQPIDSYSFNKCCEFLQKLMQLLHPFMPFITEEVYHLIKARNDDDFIAVSKSPLGRDADLTQLREGDKAKELITMIRDLRNKYQVKPKEKIKLYSFSELKNSSAEIIVKLGGLSSIEKIDGDPDNAIPFLAGSEKFFLESYHVHDASEEVSRLKKDLEYHRGFLESVMKKLANEKFVANAKADVIEKERKKAEDAEEKIRLIEERLQSISQ